MKIKRLLCSTAVLLTILGGPASANIVYSFSGAIFDDGTTLNGTFTTNGAITSLLDYGISTQAGAISAFNYTPLTAGDGSTSLPSILVLEPASLDHILQVTFTGLTATGSAITIGQFDSFEQDAAGVHRQIVAGEVTVGATGPTGVPEPITLSLFGAGLLGAVAMRRRNRT